MAVTPSVCVIGSEPGTATVIYNSLTVEAGSAGEYYLPDGHGFGAIPGAVIHPVGRYDLRELRNKRILEPSGDGMLELYWVGLLPSMSFVFISDAAVDGTLYGITDYFGQDFAEADELLAIIGLGAYSGVDVPATPVTPLTGELRITFTYAGNEDVCSSFDGEEPEVPGPCDLLPATPFNSITDTWPSVDAGIANSFSSEDLDTLPFYKGVMNWQAAPAVMAGASALGLTSDTNPTPKLNNLWISIDKFADYAAAVPKEELYAHICDQYGVDPDDTEVYISAYSTVFYQKETPVSESIWGAFDDVAIAERRNKHFRIRKDSYASDFTAAPEDVMADITVKRGSTTYTAPFTLDVIQDYTPTPYSYANRLDISLLNDNTEFQSMYGTLAGDFSLKGKEDYVLLRTLAEGLTGWVMGNWSNGTIFHGWRARHIIEYVLDGPAQGLPYSIQTELVLKELVNPVASYVYEVDFDPAIDAPQTVEKRLTNGNVGASTLGTYYIRETVVVPDLPTNDAGDEFRYFISWEDLETIPYCHTTYTEGVDLFTRSKTVHSGSPADTASAEITFQPYYLPTRSVGAAISKDNTSVGLRYGNSPLTIFPSETSPYGVSIPGQFGRLPNGVLSLGINHWSNGRQETVMTYPFYAKLVLNVYNHTQYLNTAPDPLPTVNLTDEGDAGFATILRGVDANKVMNNLNQVLTGYLPFLVDKEEGQARQRPLDMNGLKVTNLGPAESGDDAITVQQLQGLV